MCAALALATPSAAPAQDYPAKPIRTIVSVSAGGIGDLFMRVLGEECASGGGVRSSSRTTPAAT